MIDEMIRVLVIGGSEDNLFRLKAVIGEVFPTAIVIAPLNGSDGIDMARLEDPDVIILDAVISGMDGIAVCQKLKKDEKTSTIPVLLLIAPRTSKKKWIQALEAGAEGFLVRPYHDLELIAHIRAMVRMKKTGKEPDRLAGQVAAMSRDLERVRRELQQDQTAMLNMLEDLKEENEARRLSEEALRESENLFRQIFETANVAKSITLPTGEVTVNRAFCYMLGYTAEELKGMTWQDLTFADDIEKTLHAIEPLLNGEKDETRFVKRYIHKNGSPIWADVNTVLMRSRRGEPVHFITTVVDITDRVRAQEALRESEERFRYLFEAESDAIVLIDNETGFIIEANKRATELYGYSHQELVSKRNTDLSAEPDESRKATKNATGAIDDIIKIPLRYHRKKDGTVFPVEITARAFYLQGRSVHIAAIRDITERLRSETALLESEERYRGIFENAVMGIFQTTPDGRYLSINPAGIRMYGYESAEEMRRSVTDMASQIYAPRRPAAVYGTDYARRVCQGI